MACLLETGAECDDQDTLSSLRPERRPIRKESPASLLVSLAAGCGLLLLLVLGAAGALVWFFVWPKTIPTAEWQSFSPAGSGCSVLMPGTPFAQSLNLNGIVAKNYQNERKRENVVFSLIIYDLPPIPIQPSILEQLATASRQHQLIQMEPGSTLASESSISLGNIPGRECQIKHPTQGMFVERMYLAKIGDTHRVYVVRAGGYHVKPNAGDAARFFDSFQLAAEAAPPTFEGGAEGVKAKPPRLQP